MTAITRKPAFWIGYAIVAIVALGVAARLFPLAIPIVNLDIAMSRDDATARARALATKLSLAPEAARVAVRFSHDSTTQNYVELEGGGKPAFTKLAQGGRYSPFFWEVRLFTLGAVDETVIRLSPNGAPLGFAHRIAETYVRDPARKALDAASARAIAETRARDDWGIDFSRYKRLEQSQQTQVSGRVDHTFTYEQPDPIGEARIRLLLTVAGDELTGVGRYVHIPESFGRRYQSLRSANDLIANLATVSAGLLYGLGGCVLAVLWLARRHWLLWRPPLVAGLVVGGLLACASLASADTSWFDVNTTETAATFWLKHAGLALLIVAAGGLAYALVFMAAESLSRRAFPHQPQLWRLWSREAAASPQIAGRTFGGYLFVPLELALIALFYYATNRYLGWWQPSEVLTDPNILGSKVPALSPIAISLQAGFMEECVFRAIPLSLGALIGARFGRRSLGIALAVIVQALIFGGAHANYPGFPAYSRPVELLLPSIVWALIFLRFGLLPTILLHATFDLSLFSIPLFLVDARGAHVQQALVIAAALVPLAMVALRRFQAGAWHELPAALRNGGWSPALRAPEAVHASVALTIGRASGAFQRALPVLGVAGLVAWILLAPFRADVPPLTLPRNAAIAAADAALAAQGVHLGPEWHRFATVRLANEEPQQWLWHKFVWQEAGPDVYRQLIGKILAPPVWQVRYMTFEGDVVERAEEWRISIANDKSVRAMSHVLPESRAGANLSRDAALALAQKALTTRFGVDPAPLSLVAADQEQRPARTDWSFVFGDPRIVVGAGGEARYLVNVAGDQVSGAGRYVHVPETWTRGEQEVDNKLQVVALGGFAVFFAAGLAALIVGIVSFVRHRVDTRALAIVFVVTFVLALLSAANAWPTIAMSLSTTEPLASQLTMKVLGGIASALVGALLLALCAGVGVFGATLAPARTLIGRWPAGLAAIAAGAFVIGLQTALSALAVSDQPTWPSAGWASQSVPLAGAALSGFGFVGLASAELFVVYVVSRLTRGFSQRLWLAVAVVLALECAAALAQGRANLAGALIGGLIAGVVASGVLLMLLRYDPRLVPAFAATTVLLGGAVKAAQSSAWLPFAIEAIATIIVAVVYTRYLVGVRDDLPVSPAKVGSETPFQ
ncbi:MAG TPA: CPBP family intramembrane glutamic endopeptidase [Casimicrobiaceae bacterium]|nr:CPBP family intramembrane glutamic endopeptidase [Casimicrobiaceae bacterium]